MIHPHKGMMNSALLPDPPSIAVEATWAPGWFGQVVVQYCERERFELNEAEWRKKVVRRYVWLSFSGPIASTLAVSVAYLIGSNLLFEGVYVLLAAIVLPSPLVGLYGVLRVFLEPDRTEESSILALLGLLGNLVVICLMSVPFWLGFD